MKLADIIDTFITGDWGEESPTQDTPNAAYCVRGADIVPITNHNFTDIPQRYVCDRTKETKLLAAGDLVIEKSGGSPTQSTGRIVYVSEDLIKAKGNVVCSNFCTAFRVKAGWNPLYVYYFWQNVYNHGAFFNFEGKTSGIKNLQLDNALSAIDIEYLPLEKQNQIVASFPRKSILLLILLYNHQSLHSLPETNKSHSIDICFCKMVYECKVRSF